MKFKPKENIQLPTHCEYENLPDWCFFWLHFIPAGNQRIIKQSQVNKFAECMIECNIPVVQNEINGKIKQTRHFEEHQF